MSSLTLTDVSKTFGRAGRDPHPVHAVEEVSLTIADGEFLVLLGPSGCGKSTLLRMIAGLEEVTAGSIKLGDRDVTHAEPKDRDVAMVFQNYALYPHMSVENNLGFALRMRGDSKAAIRSRVEETAVLLGLGDLLHRKPRELSGGQMQRVAVGRAIVRQPAAFLFDEPLSNLDAALRDQLRRELKSLHQRLKATMVYVTHDQTEAMTLGDRIAVMNGGTVQQVGPPAEVYDRPANTFVAGFIGSPPMNLLPVESIPSQSFPEGTATVGFRPEHGSFASPGVDASSATISIAAEVRDIQRLGGMLLVEANAAEATLILSVTPEKEPSRGRAAIVIEPKHVHLFDRSGTRIRSLADPE
ncbi:ABC transporter ATP-binding protein [Stratiformator vulcanicus]|uniref:sn-glycerol-3-phosphate import ATP-binding protein UgpC n=1 Tax=Stratiformator vulcanicus TaxID=2527980 RepID=A0A517QXK2_9PLAN|nr:sn-glycerol-3-phosphate ABC transporter ATP-binding protein UgpC [Stratiformator vulcanicus]QDT36323.1 sn-glycerol-3-phosphate import ATP-binding protein UgpC [Stratiformator vulcanicus]